MRIAKPTEEIIKDVREFAHAVETVLDNRHCQYNLRSSESEWRRWDDDDEEKQIFNRICSNLAAELDIPFKDVDDRIVAFEYLRSKYSGRVGHIIMTAEVLIDNVCDPQKDFLDFHPGFEFNHVATEM